MEHAKIRNIEPRGLCCLSCSSLSLFLVLNHSQMVDEALPLLMKLEVSKGGLGFSESDIGSVLMIGGPSVMLVSFCATAPVERRFGAPAMFRGAMLAVAPVLSGFWLLGLVWGRLTFWQGRAVASAALFAKGTGLSLAFSATFIMITNAVPPEHLGQANGLGQSFASLARAAGPAVCGAVWSLATDIGFLPLPFLVIGAGCAACLALTCFLPASLRYSHGHVAAASGHERAARSSQGGGQGRKPDGGDLELDALL